MRMVARPSCFSAVSCVRISAALAVSVLLVACSGKSSGFIAPAGTIAYEQRDYITVVSMILAFVYVPLAVVLPAVLWRYRRRGGKGDYTPEWQHSTPLEIFVWGGPLVIVALLSALLWVETHRLDPYRDLGGEKPLEIQVVALDWKWLFLYPDGRIASVNQLVVPTDRDIALSLTSDSTMQSFMVPRLGGQIYVMAGMRTKLHLRASKAGSYHGLNTQYNGRGFKDQHFIVQALPPAAFSRWITSTQARPAMTTENYSKLAKPSLIGTPIIFGGAPPQLFANILQKYHYHPETTLPKHPK